MEIGFSEVLKNFGSELLEKAKKMEKISDPKELDKPLAKLLSNTGEYDDMENDDEKLEPNSKIEIDGDIYETDDNGDIFKVNGELCRNTVYIVNGFKYTTDENGRIIAWEGYPKYTPDNERNENAQMESGGEDRQEGDDGGHIEARILGGSSGSENIVPMRDTLNRGDYKKTENEIAEAKKQDKDVQDSGKIIYKDDSSRPSKIERTYEIEGEKSELTIDNVKGSKDLLEYIEDNISDEDMESLKNEIIDMEEDECKASVTSILKKNEENGDLVLVKVGIRNETTGEKTYRTYEAKKG